MFGAFFVWKGAGKSIQRTEKVGAIRIVDKEGGRTEVINERLTLIFYENGEDGRI